MKIKPLADRVLVKNDKAETKTASGLIIPEAAQEKTQTAVVVEVGPGTDEDKITVKKGDRIMYDKYAGMIKAPIASFVALKAVFIGRAFAMAAPAIAARATGGVTSAIIPK